VAAGDGGGASGSGLGLGGRCNCEMAAVCEEMTKSSRCKGSRRFLGPVKIGGSISVRRDTSTGSQLASERVGISSFARRMVQSPKITVNTLRIPGLDSDRYQCVAA
jgi:hypothetical protein